MKVQTVFTEKANADVADVVAGSEVEVAKGGQLGERLEAGVRDADAEAQVDLIEVGKSG